MSHVAVVGAGVIGRSWVAQLVAHGVDVRVSDPAPGTEERVVATVESARAALEELGHDLGDWRALLTVCGSAAEAVEGARFVQESGPERDDVRRLLVAEVDEAAPPATPVASSTSTVPPSRIAAMASRHPERFLVGHPFHPVHLVPLVEVVGAPDTDPRVVDAAMAFYALVGKRPIRVRREVPGHLANRLQAALWREAYALVEAGVASVADVDAAIAHGPGLRWALLGPLVNQHLSGGEGGLRHVLEHLGPPTQELMDDLGDVRLTPALAETLVAGVDEELAGLDQAGLSSDRDALLLALLAAKARADHLP